MSAMTHPPASSPRNPSRCPASTAGNTALCTVGRSGNDLHYRGYDILDIAEQCEFEEVAYLLVHGKLPTARRARELQAQAASRCAACPQAVKRGARMHTGRGAPDGRDAHRLFGARHRAAGKGRSQPARRARHRRPPDGLVRLDAALLVSLQPQRAPHRGRDRRRLDRRAFPAPAARQDAGDAVGEARCTPRSTSTPSTNSMRRPLPAASSPAPAPTCIRRSPAASARCAAPSTAAPTKSRFEVMNRYETPDEAENDIVDAHRQQGSRDRLRPPGLHHRRSAQQGDQGSRAQAVEGRERHDDVRRSPTASRR